MILLALLVLLARLVLLALLLLLVLLVLPPRTSNSTSVSISNLKLLKLLIKWLNPKGVREGVYVADYAGLLNHNTYGDTERWEYLLSFC